MRLSGVRRAALTAGLATVAALALTACSAGQVAETSLKRPSNSGVNADTADSSIAIRNLQVVYNGPEGYVSSGDAPLEVAIFNKTTAEVTVNISSAPAEGASAQVVSARQVGLSGGAPSAAAPSAAAPSASASAPAAEPVLAPARITIAPMGYASFLPGDPQQLLLVGLSDRLTPGMSVNLIFEFSNGAAPLTLAAPTGTATSPAPRGSAVEGENHESEGE